MISSMQAEDAVNAYLETVRAVVGQSMSADDLEAIMGMLDVCKSIHVAASHIREIAEDFSKKFGGDINE